MELWTGILSWWKCHWSDLKSAGLFPRSLFLNFLKNLNIVTLSLRFPAFFEPLMPLTNWCSIYARWSKSSLKHSIRFCGIIFSKFKTEFYCILYFQGVLTSRLHFWNSPAVAIRVYSNCCCSCWFEPEIIKIGQSSHKMHSNNILNFQVSTTILNACTKRSGNLLNAPRRKY